MSPGLPFPLFRRPPPGRPRRFSAHYEGVLGTSLEVGLLARPGREDAGVAAVLAEIDRLEWVYSRFDSGSELNRWLADPALEPSAELAGLLRMAEEGRQLTAGVFHPSAEGLVGLWREAECSGREPDAVAIRALLTRLQAPVWSRRPGFQPDVPLNLNALAKGHIADQAAEAGLGVEGVDEVLVHLGGDLRHLGAAGVTVGITNPLAPYDNAPPLVRLRLCGQGMASSGALRGFQVADRWYSHVLDSRSGRPAEQVPGASVVAPDCAADLLATAFSVLPPPQSLALADELEGVACLIVTAEGQRLSNLRWQELVVS